MDSYTIGRIVNEVCEVIYRKFVSKHMAVPNKTEFLKIAADYESMWNFPNCIGRYAFTALRMTPLTIQVSLITNYYVI